MNASRLIERLYPHQLFPKEAKNAVDDLLKVILCFLFCMTSITFKIVQSTAVIKFIRSSRCLLQLLCLCFLIARLFNYIYVAT